MRSQILAACCLLLLCACVGNKERLPIGNRLLFDGSENHSINHIAYDGNEGPYVLISYGIDLVLTGERIALVRQMNASEASCSRSLRVVCDSLKQCDMMYLYWIILLDKVPGNLSADDQDGQIASYLRGPFDEASANDALKSMLEPDDRLHVIYQYDVHFLPRWMKLTDTSYYNDRRYLRWWEI